MRCCIQIIIKCKRAPEETVYMYIYIYINYQLSMPLPFVLFCSPTRSCIAQIVGPALSAHWSYSEGCVDTPRPSGTSRVGLPWSSDKLRSQWTPEQLSLSDPKTKQQTATQRHVNKRYILCLDPWDLFVNYKQKQITEENVHITWKAENSEVP